MPCLKSWFIHILISWCVPDFLCEINGCCSVQVPWWIIHLFCWQMVQDRRVSQAIWTYLNTSFSISHILRNRKHPKLSSHIKNLTFTTREKSKKNLDILLNSFPKRETGEPKGGNGKSGKRRIKDLIGPDDTLSKILLSARSMEKIKTLTLHWLPW